MGTLITTAAYETAAADASEDLSKRVEEVEKELLMDILLVKKDLDMEKLNLEKHEAGDFSDDLSKRVVEVKTTLMKELLEKRGFSCTCTNYGNNYFCTQYK